MKERQGVVINQARNRLTLRALRQWFNGATLLDSMRRSSNPVRRRIVEGNLATRAFRVHRSGRIHDSGTSNRISRSTQLVRDCVTHWNLKASYSALSSSRLWFAMRVSSFASSRAARASSRALSNARRFSSRAQCAPDNQSLNEDRRLSRLSVSIRALRSAISNLRSSITARLLSSPSPR